jgi:hypothetical protein
MDRIENTMNVFHDSPDFFKTEIEAAELELTQPITDERRTQLTKQIAAARAYLADPDAFLKS